MKIESDSLARSLRVPEPRTATFFLWGPRQVGKSTLLRQSYPDAALWIDLLKTDQLRRYIQKPAMLREQAAGLPKNSFVVIDEIQKVPELLDEVHWLHENQGLQFALCGSSARKVRKGHANLLGGRALRYELYGLVSQELGSDFQLTRLLNHGYMPRFYASDNVTDQLDAYVGTYLKEEIMAEGLTRKLPEFTDFLGLAALSDGEIVNYSTIARDCGVSSPTVQSYFTILIDTLLGHWLPAFRKRPKRKVVAAPKFYFVDVGIVNFLAKRGVLEPGSALFGKAFENWVHHELRTYNAYARRFASLFYWHLSSGAEVDFIVNDMKLAIECKAVSQVRPHHLNHLRELYNDHPEVERRILVSLDVMSRRFDDGIEALHVSDFCTELWSGNLF